MTYEFFSKKMCIFMAVMFSTGGLWLLISLFNYFPAMSYSGFAVDKDDNLYIGKDRSIDVFTPEGELIRKIDPLTNRGYFFTISKENDIIVNLSNDNIAVMDTEGNVKERHHARDRSERMDSLTTLRFTAADRTQYRMKLRFFRNVIYKIENDNKIMIYEMPVYDYIMKLYAIALCISFMTGLPILLIGQKRKTKENENVEEYYPMSGIK